MTDLSVVIVSYNVRAFLEQCLVSVERAAKGLDVEVWVVDNKSVDGSVDMVKRRFPWVKLIANEDNVGFSVANNQAIRKSSGKHVLLLNPDTVVREDTFAKGLEHMEAHPNVGGMGVPMYDGTGQVPPRVQARLAHTVGGVLPDGWPAPLRTHIGEIQRLLRRPPRGTRHRTRRHPRRRLHVDAKGGPG